MKVLKTVLLIVFCLLFFVFNFAYITSKGADNTVLNQAFYKNVFEETNVISDAKDIVFESMNKKISESEGAQQAQMKEVMIPAIKESLSNEWIEQKALGVTADILPYLKNEKQGLKSVIDLKDKKQEIIHNMAVKTKEVVEEKGYAAGTVNGIEKQIKTEFGDKIPEKIDVSQKIAGMNINSEIAQFRQIYSYYNFIPFIVYGIFLILFLMLVGLWSGFKWLGGTVLGSAAILSGLIFSLKGTFFTFIQSVGQFPDFVEPELIRGIFDVAITGFLKTALIFAGIGILLIIIGIFEKKFFRVKTD